MGASFEGVQVIMVRPDDVEFILGGKGGKGRDGRVQVSISAVRDETRGRTTDPGREAFDIVDDKLAHMPPGLPASRSRSRQPAQVISWGLARSCMPRTGSFCGTIRQF